MYVQFVACLFLLTLPDNPFLQVIKFMNITFYECVIFHHYSLSPNIGIFMYYVSIIILCMYAM